MTDLNKLLREKLEAKDDLMDAHKYNEVRDNIKQLDYILQRIVPNYDELVAQYRAIKDIEEAGK